MQCVKIQFINAIELTLSLFRHTDGFVKEAEKNTVKPVHVLKLSNHVVFSLPL